MAGPPGSLYRLNYSRRHLKDDILPQLRRELPLGKANYPYEEVDFSQNELSSGGMGLVLEVCKRCPKLRVLKLYKNQIDDGGAEGLADLCRTCPQIEEIHLSHNHFTAVGVEILVTAAEQARPNHVSPLWLRLEHNDVNDPEAVYRDLSSRLSVCNRVDEVRCTVRVCSKKQKVHLPFFHLQRSGRLRDGPPAPLPGGDPSYRVPRGEAGSPVYNPSQRVTPKHGEPNHRSIPGLMNPPSRSVVNTPKSGGATPNGTSAWDVSGASVARRFNAQSAASAAATVAASGTGTGSAPPPPPAPPGGASQEAATPASAGAPATTAAGSAAATGATTGATGRPDQSTEKADTSRKVEEQQQQPLQSAGQRPSLVLDKQGRRRILPKQLEAEGGSNSQFVCPLCTFVIIRPVITNCSHLFCDTCFRNWVEDQVSKHKKSVPGDGPVPLIQCPQPKCASKLRKKDIMPMDQADGTKVALQLLQRMRNNLQLRCVHHVEHFKYPFGQDAERVKSETGKTCTWVGDLPSYEEHVRKCCPIEIYLGGPPAGCGAGDAENGHSPAASQTPTSQLPGSSPNSGAATAAGEQGSAKAASAAQSSASAARSGSAGVAGAEATAAQKSEPPPAEDCQEPPGETRVARYDYAPRDTDKAQIPLKQNDLVKIFEVTESGWAAGVRLCRKTGQEQGVAGWFPATYLYPADHVDVATA